jgi:hypothetical protein
MNILVETTGQFGLLDSESWTSIPHDRPALVRATNFIASRAACGQLKILLQDVPEDIKDEHWVKLWDEAKTAEAAVKALENKIRPPKKE